MSGTPLISGQAQFSKLRDAFLTALASADVSPNFHETFIDDADPQNVVLDGRFNVDLALRPALLVTGLLVEIS